MIYDFMKMDINISILTDRHHVTLEYFIYAQLISDYSRWLVSFYSNLAPMKEHLYENTSPVGAVKFSI